MVCLPALMRSGSTSSSDRKSTRLNSSHLVISYAVFCLKKKNKIDAAALVVPRPYGADDSFGQDTMRVPACLFCSVAAWCGVYGARVFDRDIGCHLAYRE